MKIILLISKIFEEIRPKSVQIKTRREKGGKRRKKGGKKEGKFFKKRKKEANKTVSNFFPPAL